LVSFSQSLHDLRVWVFRGQQAVTSAAVLRDELAVLRLVIAIVAAKAAWEIQMTEVVGVGAPRDVHVREDISIVNVNKGLGGLLDLGVLAKA